MNTFTFSRKDRETIELWIDQYPGTQENCLKYVKQLIDRIEQIVSERITPEQDTIKPYHEHGNSVASDRTESGESVQSAEEYLRNYMAWSNAGNVLYEKFVVVNAMTTYASHVCADKEREIRTLERFRLEDAASAIKDQLISYEQIKSLRSELAKANESLTVMLRKNAELEAQIDQFTNPLRIG